jgi:hypothetical protein
MTTTITISTADWPVRVSGETKENYGWNAEPEQIMAPHSQTVVHIHALKRLIVEELPIYGEPEMVEDPDVLQDMNVAETPIPERPIPPTEPKVPPKKMGRPKKSK